MSISKTSDGVPQVGEAPSVATSHGRRIHRKTDAQRIRHAVEALRDLSKLLPIENGYDLKTILHLVGVAVAARVTPARLEALILEERDRYCR
jgi:hypothetical protein